MMMPCVVRGGGLMGDTRTVMGMRVSIGDGSHIGIPGFRYQRQEDGSWKELEHHGKVIIGSDVDIGYNCTVCRGTDRDTTIGDGTKIDNMVHIGHNCKIGKHVIIGAGAIIGGSCVLDDYAVVKLGEVIPARTHIPARTVGFGACHWDLPVGKKLLITDLDDTLWKDVLADGGDVVVYAEYAKQLKELADVGILLVYCTRHPVEPIGFDVVMERAGVGLRLSDFVTGRWGSLDKVEDIKDIIRSLNLLPESVVFIDDSPHERDWVSRNIPTLTVCDDLDKTMFKTEMLTLEDKKRLRMYKEEQLRQQTKVGMTHEEWIKSLNMILTMHRLEEVEEKNPEMVKRCLQLLAKTNQMKLNDGVCKDILLGDNWYFTLSDKFGDYGIIAVALLQDGERLTQFVMSCRVMGRGIEDMIFDSFDIKNVDFEDTGKNKPMADFLRRRGLIE